MSKEDNMGQNTAENPFNKEDIERENSKNIK